MRIVAAALLTLVLLGGCAREITGYPSLKRRPGEAVTFAEPVRPTPVAAPDPMLDATIRAQTAKLDAAVAAFDRDLVVARRLAGQAAGKPVGSDAWLSAQNALTALDAHRSETAQLLGEVDALGSERAARLAAHYAALDALRERAAAESERQSAAVAEVQAALPAA